VGTINHKPKNIKISQALTAGNVARHLLDGERPTSVVTPKNAPNRSVPTAQVHPAAGGKNRAATLSHSTAVQAGRSRNPNSKPQGFERSQLEVVSSLLVSGQDTAATRAKAPLCFEANSTLTPPTETPKRQKVEKSRPLAAPFDWTKYLKGCKGN